MNITAVLGSEAQITKTQSSLHRYYSSDSMKSGGMGEGSKISAVQFTGIWNYDRICAPSDTLCSAPFCESGKGSYSHRTLPWIDIIMILVILVFLSIWSDMLAVDSKFEHMFLL